jgi:hypothetical protein
MYGVTQSFCFRRPSFDAHSGPHPDVTKLYNKPSAPGSIAYNKNDNFLYVSDGKNWDKISGVNNPADNLLPITQHTVPKWTEDYPPGGDYPTPVLQDSSLCIDDDGNAILNDSGNDLVAFPWTNGNMVTKGSMVTSRTFGMAVGTDVLDFVPVLSQIPGNVPADTMVTKDHYQDGSIAIGFAAMENIINGSALPVSKGNVIIGTRAMQHSDPSASNNVIIGHNSVNTGVETKFQGYDNTIIGANSLTGIETKNSVVVGANSITKQSNNVIVGSKSTDDNHQNVVIVGSNVGALGDNRVVIGSGIKLDLTVPPSMNVAGYLSVQIGTKTYKLALYDEETL